MKSLNVLDWIVMILVFVGGINWGLVGFFHFNLVHAIFGSMPMVARVVYCVVGIAAIYFIYLMFSVRKKG